MDCFLVNTRKLSNFWSSYTGYPRLPSGTGNWSQCVKYDAFRGRQQVGISGRPEIPIQKGFVVQNPHCCDAGLLTLGVILGQIWYKFPFLLGEFPYVTWRGLHDAKECTMFSWEFNFGTRHQLSRYLRLPQLKIKVYMLFKA